MKILRDVSEDSHVLPLFARRRRRRRSYYEAHQHGTGRDSWDTKGRRQPHGQIRIRRVGGRATRIRERPRGTLGWIDRQAGLRCSAPEDRGREFSYGYGPCMG